jgi:AcrR family transcriptional regulator
VGVATRTPPKLRRDAAENRQRILDAAGGLFAQEGIDAPMEDVARRAGVGSATLYRRFPSKDALLEAILEERLAEYVALAERAAASERPFAGLVAFLEAVVELQARDRGFAGILATRLADEERLARLRRRTRPLLEQLVARAHAEGTLRRDVAATDVPVLLWQLGRVVEATADVAPDAWRRYLALAVDGLRAEAGTPLPAPALTLRQLDTAMTTRR